MDGAVARWSTRTSSRQRAAILPTRCHFMTHATCVRALIRRIASQAALGGARTATRSRMVGRGLEHPRTVANWSWWPKSFQSDERPRWIVSRCEEGAERSSRRAISPAKPWARRSRKSATRTNEHARSPREGAARNLRLRDLCWFACVAAQNRSSCASWEVLSGESRGAGALEFATPRSVGNFVTSSAEPGDDDASQDA
jgi:hypothetical protein